VVHRAVNIYPPRFFTRTNDPFGILIDLILPRRVDLLYGAA
jgi:hypothetical protein